MIGSDDRTSKREKPRRLRKFSDRRAIPSLECDYPLIAYCDASFFSPKTPSAMAFYLMPPPPSKITPVFNSHIFREPFHSGSMEAEMSAIVATAERAFRIFPRTTHLTIHSDCVDAFRYLQDGVMPKILSENYWLLWSKSAWLALTRQHDITLIYCTSERSRRREPVYQHRHGMCHEQALGLQRKARTESKRFAPGKTYRLRP